VDHLAAKQELRQRALAARRVQADRERLSEIIWQRIAALPEYGRASSVMTYVGVGDEVATLPYFAWLRADGKQIVVPYCRGGVLELFRLEDAAELAPSTFGLLEPKRELRGRAERRVAVEQLDLLVVPGLAFDRQGGRLGYGKGYYDKLLGKLRVDATAIAAAFECQVVPMVPMLPHDVPMDYVATDAALYRGGGRRPPVALR
jgi:5-formyltetrahydrofolate cyclo-ligase